MSIDIEKEIEDFIKKIGDAGYGFCVFVTRPIDNKHEITYASSLNNYEFFMLLKKYYKYYPEIIKIAPKRLDGSSFFDYMPPIHKDYYKDEI